MEKEEYLHQLKEKFLKLKQEIEQSLIKADKSKHNHLQNYIYFAHHPIFSFTESILILCENKKPNTAKVLLRTLFESHINLIYHQLGNSEQRLAFSAKSMFDERFTVLKEILDLIEEYPEWESEDSKNLFNKEYLNKQISIQTEHREAILRANPGLFGIKRLQEKAKLCDSGEVKNAKRGHFKYTYTVIYRYLSSFTHQNIEGLQAFVDQNKEGVIFFHDGSDEDFVATRAVEISIAFCKDLYDNNILTGEQFAVVHELEELMSQANKIT